MKIIFDSGSTSTAFAIVSPDTGPSFHALPHGHNAVTSPDGSLSEMLSMCGELSLIAGKTSRVDYYGAGCATPTVCSRIRTELLSVFPTASICVESDMAGAARALCGGERGIACILGTGSNSCLWDGGKIVDNASPLGYILGDEGSGAVMGRLFLGLLLKGRFPDAVTRRFAERYDGISTHEIINRVYREERPNAFLASFAPFILDEAGRTDEVRQFVTGEFRRFLKYNVEGYDDARELPVSFLGSVAWHFRDFLSEALYAEGLHAGRFLRDPLPALANR